MNIPGFTAEASLYNIKDHYQSPAANGYSGAEQGIVPQMRIGGACGPFSGSCGCGPGYCCCILCYFNSCYFWCWSSIGLSQAGFSRV